MKIKNPKDRLFALLVLYYLYDGKLFRNKRIDSSILTLIALGFIVNWAIPLF